MDLDRTKAEALATYLSVVVLAALTCLSILAAADGVFRWNLLPPLLDKVAVLAIYSLLIILGAAVLASIMLNMSIIASRLSTIAEQADRHGDEQS